MLHVEKEPVESALRKHLGDLGRFEGDDGADKRRVVFDLLRKARFVQFKNSRGSATAPRIALAAAVSGEARKVREPCPCRPSKLRFDVLTHYFPAGT
jgi:hypothetical protein